MNPLDPKQVAESIVGEVEKQILAEESKEIQASNVSSTRRDAEDMDSGEAEIMDQEENSGTDSKSRQKSDADKYKSVHEMADKEVGSDVEDEEDMSDHTVANTDLEKTGEKDENTAKRDSELTADTGLVNEDMEMGDEEEPEEESGEDTIRQKVEEALRSEESAAAIKEHITAMFSVDGDKDLTEEYTAKATTIFEAAINERTQQITDIVIAESLAVMEQTKAVLQENAEKAQEELVEQIDEYLTHVCEEWMKENQLEVEKGLRTELTEEFLADLTNLLETHNINVPEESYDLIEEMSDEIENLKSEINESMKMQASLASQLKESERKRVFMESTKDLTMSERERLENLSSHIVFENPETYASELKTLTESYFKNGTDDRVSETAVELNEEKKTQVYGDSNIMNLAESMSRFAEKKK